MPLNASSWIRQYLDAIVRQGSQRTLYRHFSYVLAPNNATQSTVVEPFRGHNAHAQHAVGVSSPKDERHCAMHGLTIREPHAK